MNAAARPHVGLFCLLAGSGAALDLGTKWLVFTEVGHPPAKWTLLPGVFSVTTSFNEGALWGIGRTLPYPNVIFASLSVLAATAILYWLFWRDAARDRMLTVALSFIMAGTIGNCYDRILWGKVRDFLYFEWINWPIFNIADSCLVCGAALLMAHALFAEMDPTESPSSLPQSVPSSVEIRDQG